MHGKCRVEDGISDACGKKSDIYAAPLLFS
jgi:hypothetical protein